ncbi:glycosyltransferase family 2 protein, partial [Candidatus Peregrinibacteria bacterium]|nr:glycosyltransferase family 2 protein [Candidatus Peregrinibacteria bacterium]
MTTPNISIVIPTRNRPQILRQCLDHIEKQTIADQIEVIVVIDGDDPKTAEMLSSLHWSFPLICFAIPKAQQGIARNRGMEKAHGKIVLFIGDDIFLAPDACERHIRAHARKSEIRNPKSEINLKLQTNMHTGSDFVLRASDFPIAVLGFTTWDPAVGITSVMRWLTKTGWQFGYEKIAAYGGKILPSEIQHRFTYTSHISLSRAIAQDFPFHEDVTLYGWEDVEWGIRLRDAGIPLFYEATAHALHHHR